MDFSDYKLSLVPDEKDMRDFQYKAPIFKTKKKLPKEFHLDIRAGDNQQNYGSCTAYSLAKIVEYNYNYMFELSRFFHYYNCRKADGSVSEDNGTSLRNSLKQYNKYGMCLDVLHPTICEDKFFYTEPSLLAYENGKNRTRIKYSRITSLNQLKESLVDGNPVYAGIAIYDSFYKTKSDGVVPKNSGNLNGYHAIAISGYTDTKTDCKLLKALNIGNGCLKCCNSWGLEFGDCGNFYIPYNMFNDDMFIDIWSVEFLDKKVGEVNEE